MIASRIINTHISEKWGMAFANISVGTLLRAWFGIKNSHPFGMRMALQYRGCRPGTGAGKYECKLWI